MSLDSCLSVWGNEIRFSRKSRILLYGRPTNLPNSLNVWLFLSIQDSFRKASMEQLLKLSEVHIFIKCFIYLLVSCILNVACSVGVYVSVSVSTNHRLEYHQYANNSLQNCFPQKLRWYISFTVLWGDFYLLLLEGGIPFGEA